MTQKYSNKINLKVKNSKIKKYRSSESDDCLKTYELMK